MDEKQSINSEEDASLEEVLGASDPVFQPDAATESPTSMDIEKIAEVAHETNKAYCETIGDDSQMHWDLAPTWQKDSAINGVNFHLNNPDSQPQDSHENWLKEKYADGWKYGEVKDVGKKEHPCCVPYDKLPVKQRVKDSLFLGVVRAMEVLL